MKKLSNEEISQSRISIEKSKSVERFPIYAILDNVRSLYNVGSIFRTADGALLKKLYLTGFTPSPPRKEIFKTSLGATETVPWEYFENPIDVIKTLKKENVKILAVELTNKSKPNYEILKADFPICVIFGNEINGISKYILDEVDGAIEIPMYGFKHSLNVSVSFGIVLFDIVRILKIKN
ncbi:MAG: RNA methyltransferase [Bacteroidota bacterium]